MSETLIPTRASRAKGIQKVEEVTFVAYKPKAKPKIERQITKDEESDSNLFNLVKAKNEVIKFALSNLEGHEKRKATMQLAIKLGAKAPRKKFRNYKALIQERKQEKAEESTKMELQKIGKNSIGESIAKTNLANKNRKNKFRKKTGDILDIYGKLKKVVDK